MPNKDLRDWISGIEAAGELKLIKGAEPKEEIGAFVDIYQRKMGNPALMFDEIPGFPKGHRIIANILTSVPRINIAVGLPPQASEMKLIQWWRNYMKNAPSQKPKPVNGGPLLDNVLEGKDVNIQSIPTPVWHERDGGPFIGMYGGNEGPRFRLDQLRLLSHSVAGPGCGHCLHVSRQARPDYHGQISRAETALSCRCDRWDASRDVHAGRIGNPLRQE